MDIPCTKTWYEYRTPQGWKPTEIYILNGLCSSQQYTQSTLCLIGTKNINTTLNGTYYWNKTIFYPTGGVWYSPDNALFLYPLRVPPNLDVAWVIGPQYGVNWGYLNCQNANSYVNVHTQNHFLLIYIYIKTYSD